jgi:hypothetical protein
MGEPRASKRLLGCAALSVIEQLRGNSYEVVLGLVGLDEVADAVALPAFFVALGAKLFFLAEARGVETVGGNAELHEVILNGRGAAIAEDQVVFGGAALVAAALDGHFDLRILAQEVRGLAESVAGIGADVGFVEVEVGVLHFLEEECAIVDSRRLRRRRWWWRGNSDADAGVRRAAWAAGGDRVGRGIGRSDFGRALSSDGADIRGDGELRSVGGSPAQSGGIALVD